MERHRIVVDGDPFSYLAFGPEGGSPVLCLHGFPDVPQTWEPVARRLAGRGYRVVAPFMRGYAPSTLAGPFHAERLGVDALGILDALWPGQRAAVVGHDWGAVATYAAASLAPERLGRIVTLAVPHPLAFLDNLRARPAQLARSWYIGLFQLPALPEVVVPRRDFALIERLWRAWSPGFELPEAHRRALRQSLRASMPAPIEPYRALMRRPAELARRVSAARAPERRVGVPCLYLHGADDGCVAFELAEGQERFFAAGLESELLPGCGHFLQLERPQTVADRVAEWLHGDPWRAHSEVTI